MVAAFIADSYETNVAVILSDRIVNRKRYCGIVEHTNWGRSRLFGCCHRAHGRLQYLCQSGGEETWHYYADAQRIPQSSKPLLLLVSCHMFFCFQPHPLFKGG
jgi:hypothetical protein